jgi:hypothetical protein
MRNGPGDRSKRRRNVLCKMRLPRVAIAVKVKLQVSDPGEYAKVLGVQ